MDKYKCPEHLVPMPRKTPEEVHQLLDNTEPLWMLPGCCLVSLSTNIPRLTVNGKHEIRPVSFCAKVAWSNGFITSMTRLTQVTPSSF